MLSSFHGYYGFSNVNAEGLFGEEVLLASLAIPFLHIYILERKLV
jgi:hypothetical protein